MSGMKTLAATCYILGAMAELAGVVLIVSEILASQKTLRKWRAANPESHSGGSFGQQHILPEVVDGLLGKPAKRIAGVGLLVAGILTGMVGNFASL